MNVTMCCQVYVGICVISTLKYSQVRYLLAFMGGYQSRSVIPTLKYPQARHVLLLMVDINHAVLSQRLNIPK